MVQISTIHPIKFANYDEANTIGSKLTENRQETTQLLQIHSWYALCLHRIYARFPREIPLWLARKMVASTFTLRREELHVMYMWFPLPCFYVVVELALSWAPTWAWCMWGCSGRFTGDDLFQIKKDKNITVNIPHSIDDKSVFIY